MPVLGFITLKISTGFRDKGIKTYHLPVTKHSVMEGGPMPRVDTMALSLDPKNHADIKPLILTHLTYTSHYEIPAVEPGAVSTDNMLPEMQAIQAICHVDSSQLEPDQLRYIEEHWIPGNNPWAVNTTEE